MAKQVQPRKISKYPIYKKKTKAFLKTVFILSNTKNKSDIIKNNYIYHYINLDSFLSSSNKGLRFTNPINWLDKFESIYLQANYGNNANTCQKDIYASCFTTDRDSENIWKNYMSDTSCGNSNLIDINGNKVELGKIVLRIRIKRTALLNAMETSKLGNFYESKMIYASLVSIASLYKRTSNSRYRGFITKPFNQENLFSLLSLKREFFKAEKEVRFFLLPQISNQNYYELPWNQIIDTIWFAAPNNSRLDSKSQSVCIRDIQTKLQNLGIKKSISIQYRDLYGIGGNSRTIIQW